MSKTECNLARGTHFKIGGVGYGGVASGRKLKGGTPFANKPIIAVHGTDTRLKSNVGHWFLEFFDCLCQIVIDTSWGLAAYSGRWGYGGVPSFLI